MVFGHQLSSATLLASIGLASLEDRFSTSQESAEEIALAHASRRGRVKDLLEASHNIPEPLSVGGRQVRFARVLLGRICDRG